MSKELKLKLEREIFTNKSTLGSLYVDGVFQCYVLEDVTRLPNVKVQNETAIPYGTYDVIINMSNRFKKRMPLLLNVPMFSGVRIHSGNTDKDTEGCLLTGTSRAKDVVTSSRTAFDALFKKMDTADKEGKKISIEIVKK